MVSLINISLCVFFLFINVIVQATPLLETENDTSASKSSNNNKALYLLYKMMRADPRLASVSNNDIVLYIYRNFVLGNGDIMSFIKGRFGIHHHHRFQNLFETE